MELNVIIPAYNEEGNILKLYKALTDSLNSIKYELIFVDDGSNDSTLKNITSIYNKDKEHVKIISFSRNFGKDAAIYAGMESSNSKYIAIIDADMQQDPKYIKEMLSFIKENPEYDEICMVNTYNKEKLSQKIFKKIFYNLMKKITNQNYIPGASDFRLMTSNVVKNIVDMKENNRFTKGLFSWVGFNTYYMKYTPNKRLSGESKFKLKNQIKYATDGIINFSTIPLHIASIIGAIISLISFIYFIIILIKTIILGKDIPGYASLMSMILILGGLILFVLGIIGEYVSRTYLEIKKRPIYIAKLKKGFKDDSIL